MPARESKADRRELEDDQYRLNLEEREAQISSHLVRLIDVFFALVLGQGIVLFKETIAAPWHSNWEVVLALFVVYFTVIRSFVAWHVAVEERRYRILNRRVANGKRMSVRTTELYRVYVDAAIVALYAFMLLSIRPLQDPGIKGGLGGGADLTPYLCAFPALFALYSLWGFLRERAWGEDHYQQHWLWVFCGAYVAMAIVYVADPDVGITSAQGNLIAIVLSGTLMMAFRYVNFWQGEDVPRWKIAEIRQREFAIPKPFWMRTGGN